MLDRFGNALDRCNRWLWGLLMEPLFWFVVTMILAWVFLMSTLVLIVKVCGCG